MSAGGVDPVTQVPLGETFPDAVVTTDGALVRVTLDGPGNFRVPSRMIQSAALFPTR